MPGSVRRMPEERALPSEEVRAGAGGEGSAGFVPEEAPPREGMSTPQPQLLVALKLI